MKSVSELLDEREVKARQGHWVPACANTEVPFITRTGHKVLYMWQPSTGRHAYLNLITDIFIDDSELASYGL